MKIALVALNAKFIHSSLALRSLKAYAKGLDIKLVEFTINTNMDTILSEVYNLRPKVLGFSCYIWNIDIVERLICTLKKVLPGVIIIAGGPEAEYDPERLISKGTDYIVVGEGEEAFSRLISELAGVEPRAAEKIYKSRKKLPLDDIPFAYGDSVEELENRIIYYETSRGCPYGCQYCLSSATKGVRFLSLDRVFTDLGFFLKMGVKQVKFVDRTFNADRCHSQAIWQFLIANCNGITNFHFEISADLLDEGDFAILQSAPTGLFQFEVGIQSTNMDTLAVIERRSNLTRLFENIRTIHKYGNIHQHLDLIAGLPKESFQCFKQSFNDVFSLEPQQLQLGFLKLLKGSKLRANAEELGIIYQESAPYEVLYTANISFSEMLELKGVESMLEIYYNSGQFSNTLRYLIAQADTAFDFFLQLFHFYKENGYDLISHNKIKRYSILYEFSGPDVVRELLRYDLFLNENAKNLPSWLERSLTQKEKDSIRAFYNNGKNIERYLPNLQSFEPRQISRMCHIEPFSIDILNWVKSGYSQMVKKDIYILFDYSIAEHSVEKALNAKATKIMI